MATKKKSTESAEVTAKPKQISAKQAANIVGIHYRYKLFLDKKYEGQLNDVKSWAVEFKQQGLIENLPDFLA